MEIYKSGIFHRHMIGLPESIRPIKILDTGANDFLQALSEMDWLQGHLTGKLVAVVLTSNIQMWSCCKFPLEPSLGSNGLTLHPRITKKVKQKPRPRVTNWNPHVCICQGWFTAKKREHPLYQPTIICKLYKTISPYFEFQMLPVTSC